MERVLSRSSLLLLAAAALTVFAVAPGRADDMLTIKIENHRFTPSELKVPANKRVSISVENADATPEEFESHALKVEKVIQGKSKALVRIGPLKPGRYDFVGEFHEKTAKGTIIAE
jgi:hypothetical protein